MENRATYTTANLEPDTGNASNGEKEITRLSAPCSISIHSIRHRLADHDNISAKAVIDGVVHAGILSDDSTKQVKEVTFSQEKIGRKEQEKTIITITEA